MLAYEMNIFSNIRLMYDRHFEWVSNEKTGAHFTNME